MTNADPPPSGSGETDLTGSPETESARRRATRQRLRDAAIELIADHGFAAVSIEQLCETAGFTRGAFYSNYASKEALLADTLEQQRVTLIGDLRARIDRMREPEGGLALDVSEIVRNILRDVPADPRWYLMLLELEAFVLRRPEHAESIARALQEFRTAITDLIVVALAGAERRPTLSAGDITDLVMDYYSIQYRAAIAEGRAAEFLAGQGRHVTVIAAVLEAFTEPI